MISSRSRYAVLGLLELSKLSTEGEPVKLGLLAEKSSVPLKYLEQIFARLRKASIINSVRGQAGGYIFAKDPAQISIAEIILAAEDDLHVTGCKPNSEHGCLKKTSKCLAHSLWEEVSNRIYDYLNEVTLTQLAEGIKTTKRGKTVFDHLQTARTERMLA